MRLTILYRLNCAQNSSAKVRVPSKIAGGILCMPPLDGVRRVAVVAGVPPPPPPPPPPLHPPVALADMVMVGWMGVMVEVCVVGKATVLVDAMVSLGVEVL